MNSKNDTAEAADLALDAALRAMHRSVLSEPVPPTQKEAANRLDELQRQTRQSWRGGAIAAGVMIAFSSGWFAKSQMPNDQDAERSRSQAGFAQEFVRQAGYAHAVYLPEKRHPVEVAASEQEHLVQWLSKRLGKPLKIPQLDAQGFELVGGRLLPGEAGARAQFMFQNSQGQRVTLYMGAMQKASDSGLSVEVLAPQFRFRQEGQVPSFYWAEQGFGYALSGQVDKATLMSLATLVYSQIQ